MQIRLIYLLFFFSGLAGLIYEMVWGRLLVLIFGSTTQSMVAVITAFLGGLALGSLIAGKKADRLNGQQLIKTYAWLEAGVGITAGATLMLLPVVRMAYGLISDGSVVSLGLMSLKFLLAISLLLIPTTLMGATLPVLSRWLNAQLKAGDKTVSRLYAVNTLGATSGVVLAAGILIELLGLTNTVLVAVGINLAIGGLAMRMTGRSDEEKNIQLKSTSGKLMTEKITDWWPIMVYSLSGLAAIGYEVLWTRVLTPTVGTFVYAFAAILALYLLGIAGGSFIYPVWVRLTGNKILALGWCELLIGILALGSVYLTSNQVVIHPRLMILGVILPATTMMGLTFPATVALLDQKALARSVGWTYFGNTLGSIIGGFLASFVLIPNLGGSGSIILLTLINLGLAAKLFYKQTKLIALASVGLMGLSIWLVGWKRESLYPNETQWRINWAREKNFDFEFVEDEVASVFGYKDRTQEDQNLFIDGVSTTNKVGETKLMAHIPLWLHPRPERVLIIAFGMGTTYRSALSYNLAVDVVELVPSVPKMMRLFYADASKLLAHPQGTVMINDGRNYVRLTDQKYDVVTIDPPPPFNAAGTTVLYAKEFYQDIVRKLNPGGIVSQWMWFGTRQDDVAMATKSFLEVFPYVIAFESPRGSGGIFLEGSLSPIIIDRASTKDDLDNQKALIDLNEIYPDLKFDDFKNLVIADRRKLNQWVGKVLPVTDDYPRTEYFWLRHRFQGSPSLVDIKVKDLFNLKVSF